MTRANDRLRLLEIRDSLLSAYSKHAASGLTVMIDSSLPPALSSAVDRLIRAKWQQLGVHSTLPIVVAVVMDSATNPHGLPRRYSGAFSNPIAVFLPTSTSPCVSVLRLSAPFSGMRSVIRGIVAQDLKSPETASAVFGPCAFLAKFGQPGPYVAEWLRDQGSALARLAAWDASSPPWTSRQGVAAYRFIDQMASIGDPDWQTRQVVGLAGLACIAGERGRCSGAAVGEPSPNPDSAWQQQVVSTHGASSTFFFFAVKPSALGANDSWLVSDMAHMLGGDAFGRFWKSQKPVPEAFKDASGQNLDDWIRAWARHAYGRVPAGPNLPPIALTAGTAALIAGLALAIVLERRRRVA